MATKTMSGKTVAKLTKEFTGDAMYQYAPESVDHKTVVSRLQRAGKIARRMEEAGIPYPEAEDQAIRDAAIAKWGDNAKVEPLFSSSADSDQDAELESLFGDDDQ